MKVAPSWHKAIAFWASRVREMRTMLGYLIPGEELIITEEYETVSSILEKWEERLALALQTQQIGERPRASGRGRGRTRKST